MLNVTELRAGVVFKEGNQIFQVLSYDHIKMGRGSGNVKVKVRSLKSGAVGEKSFITGARIEEAEVEKRQAQFLYQKAGQFFFMDSSTFDQFSLPFSSLGDQTKFLKEGMELQLIISEGEALAAELPHSLVYMVSETGPAERGNTVASVYKEAKLDNGLTVKVPIFIKVGDKVKVDTRTGEYAERVKPDRVGVRSKPA